MRVVESASRGRVSFGGLQMPDVTYYVALPFGLDDDRPSPREAI